MSSRTLFAAALVASTCLWTTPTVHAATGIAAFDLTARTGPDGALTIHWYPSTNLQNSVDHYVLHWTIGGNAEQMEFPNTYLECRVSAQDLEANFAVGSDAVFYVDAVNAMGTTIASTPDEEYGGNRSGDLRLAISRPLNSTLEVTLRDFEATQFPTLFAAVQVDSAGDEPAVELPQAAFEVYENGILQSNGFQVTKEGGMLDFVFLIDHSGSMCDEIQDVINNVADFAQGLEDQGYDVDFGYVRFGHDYSPNPDVMNNGDLYPTTADLLLDLVPFCPGSREPSCQAVIDAQNQIKFRPGALRQFLLITDEDSDGGDCLVAIDLCNAPENSTNIHGAVDCGSGNSDRDYCSPTTGLIPQTGGLLFAVTDPFDDIFNFLGSLINRFYMLRWVSSDSTLCVERQVDIVVQAWGEVDTASVAYTPGGVPEIERTQDTIDLSKATQIAGVPLAICAVLTDCAAPFIQDAEVYYRTTQSGGAYVATPMVDMGGGVYCGEIPGSAVETPGVDYYLKASDGQVVVFDPSTDPGNNPYQIAVWPNEAPVIEHTAVPCTDVGVEIVINATVVDSTNGVDAAKVYYRPGSTFQYSEAELIPVGGDLYEGAIPPEAIADPEGVDYYLWAIDNFGIASTDGTADAPHHVVICDTVPECVQVIVAPQALTHNPTNPYEWEIPILTSSDLSLLEKIYSFQMELTFDPDYFTLSEVTAALGMASQGYFDWNYIGASSNRVRVAWASANELVNTADSRFFTLLGGAVVGAPCMETSAVTVDTVLFNQESPCADAIQGTFEIPGMLFGGTLNYFSCDTLSSTPQNPRPLAGAEVAFSRDCGGSLIDTVVVTDVNGDFTISGCSFCEDCLTPSAPQLAATPAISEFDAWSILEYLVEYEALDLCALGAQEYDPTGTGQGVPVLCDPPADTPEEAIDYAVPPFSLLPQRIAADCSGNGIIQAYDASLILMYAVGDSTGLASLAGSWDFYCESRCYVPEIQYPDFVGDADFTGILRGDVSGDWPAPAPLSNGAELPVQLTVGTQTEGGVVDLYLTATDLESLYCGYVELRYPESRYELVSGGLSDSCGGFRYADNEARGSWRLAFAGERLAAAPDPYAHMQLRVRDGGELELDDLTFILRVNDNQRPATLVTPPNGGRRRVD
jgi:hypothetical protein